METKYIEKEKFEEEKRYLRALNRVKRIQGFYWHLFLYLAIVIALVIVVYGGFEEKGGVFQFVNYIHYDNPTWNIYWFWFPFVIWGVVVLLQGIYVFGFRSNWEERKIRELMDKEEINSFKS